MRTDPPPDPDTERIREHIKTILRKLKKKTIPDASES